LGEALDEVSNTFLPNVHSICSGGEISWHYYMDYLTSFFSPSAYEFTFGLEKLSCHFPSKISWLVACGMLLLARCLKMAFLPIE
jgi:hypothetical protein